MLNIDVVTNELNYELGKKGKVKPLYGVNGIPLSIAPGYPELQKQFNEMGITDIRLHDTYGPLDIDNHYSEEKIAEQIMVNIPEDEKKKQVNS